MATNDTVTRFEIHSGHSKCFQEQALFFLGNAFLIPTIGVVGVMCSGAGLRAMVPFLSTNLFRFSALGWLRDVPYLQDLDLAEVLVMGLIAMGLVAWIELLKAIAAWPTDPNWNPFFLVTILIWVIIIVADAVIFYNGLKSTNVSLWSGGETTTFVALLATILYMTVFAAIARWHYSYFYGDQ